MIAIVDSSVAVKWYAAEADSALAEKLLLHPIGAPDFILAEVGNALWKKVQRSELRIDQALAAMPHLEASLTLLPASAMAGRALDLAMRLRHPVYDCYFLVLSIDTGLPLITSDARLSECARQLGSDSPVVTLADWKEPDER